MANEAVCLELPAAHQIRRITVADGTAITKGTIMKISSDPNTGLASAGADKFAGITMSEKTASDGVTEMAVARGGKWDITCAGSGCTLGALVALSGANLIRDAVEADFPLGAVFGQSLETGSAAEVVAIQVLG